MNPCIKLNRLVQTQASFRFPGLVQHKRDMGVAQRKHMPVFFFIGKNLCASLCLCAAVVKKGTPQRPQGTKNFAENVVQQPRDTCAISVFSSLFQPAGKQLLKLLHMIFLSLSSTTVSSQMIVASGIVQDENNKPIANCHIAVKDTNLGTVTNGQGLFTLKIPKDHCNITLLVSYVGYHTQTVRLKCQDKSNIVVRLNDKIHQLKEVKVNARSPSQIVLQAILNLEKNYQVDSVTYTLFSRITDTVDALPVLIKEFVLDLYHGKKTIPAFYIEKIRVKGFNKLGEKRLQDSRLTDVYVTGSHIMLRYLPSFLKKSKMKRYRYTLADDVIIDDDHYYVIMINSTKKNYPDKGTIRINKKNYGISYLEQQYAAEHWDDMSHLNFIQKSHYKQVDGKWYFVHGTRSYDELLKEQNITIKHHQVTVATDRVQALPLAERPKMGVMVKMLKDFTGSYDDKFWEHYNFIPSESRFKDN